VKFSKKTILAPFLVLSIILFWGLNWPLFKIVLQHITPQTLAFTRVFIALIFFTFLMLITGTLKLPKKTDWAIILSVGINQMTLYILFVSTGLLYINANRGAILGYITPLFVIPISYFVLRQKPTLWTICGFLIGMIGVIVMFNPLELDLSTSNTIQGSIFVITAAFFWAINIIFIRSYRHDFSSFQLLPWQLLTASILLFLFAWYEEPDFNLWFDDIDFKSILILIFTGVFGTGYGFWAAVKLNRMLDANTLSMCMLLIPISGFIFSILLLGESILLSNVIGLISILVGIIISMGDKLKLKKTKQHDR